MPAEMVRLARQDGEFDVVVSEGLYVLLPISYE